MMLVSGALGIDAMSALKLSDAVAVGQNLLFTSVRYSDAGASLHLLK
jgi:hypothetical protein